MPASVPNSQTNSEAEIHSINDETSTHSDILKTSNFTKIPKPLSINIGGSINAISFNKLNTQMVVAGREVLKIISMETMKEEINMRISKATMIYSSNDVKWNKNDGYEHLIASAATNGSVVLWNLNIKNKKIGVFFY